MITDEPVRGSIPPPWFWALSGLERMEAFSNGLIPAPPLARLTGMRPAHVGPGSGTWTMPASGWVSGFNGILELSVFAGSALHGIAMTAAPPGATVQPLTVDIHHFRPTRPQPGNLLARGRVVNASQFFTFTEVQIEDAEGRQLASVQGHAAVRQMDPPPPPPPDDLRPVEEPSYATPDPYIRPAPSTAPRGELWGEPLRRAVAEVGAEGRPFSPLGQLLGFLFVEGDRGQIDVTASANEWLCLFSRSVAVGPLAVFLNAATTIAGTAMRTSDQSFAGLMQSVVFTHPVPADGRTLSVETEAADRHGDQLIATAHMLDADGSVVGSIRGVAALVKTSKRRKPATVEAKRELCTLLFTDIVNSTAHAERLGDAKWRRLLDQHHQVVRREIARCTGTEIDTAGDGFFVRFDTPAQALDCARAVRNAVPALGIEIRAGIHMGECEVHGRSLAGMAVHIGARIEAAADPGEILVSGTVKDLVVGSGTPFEDRGEHELKGVPDTWRLYAVVDS